MGAAVEQKRVARSMEMALEGREVSIQGQEDAGLESRHAVSTGHQLGRWRARPSSTEQQKGSAEPQVLFQSTEDTLCPLLPIACLSSVLLCSSLALCLACSLCPS